ncbi:putative molibdopterin-dependent oxidoreductase YjgC [Arthrobacter sp. PvP102]|uniref:hypothetical protein n=1 Tax=unclassified Arthrobacter TaxID=235627 RepID=UPI001B55DBB7|nr:MULTISPECIES: hypothetical protein [unclassified Arthrobacter]MBP1234485.1 putative molibdopterin-dependent oxidoreductase YjgC [Arthrobacter sp. PvP103]MBP1239619.1 putative molibdopterin-dependent oxidoreductase YjgC [Arthrobacter sp. PvP102]
MVSRTRAWTGRGRCSGRADPSIPPGTPRLYQDRFATPDGLAHLVARPYLPPGEQCDADFPFLLITGRRAEHYNSGSMTRRTDNLRLLARETVDVERGDAAAL